MRAVSFVSCLLGCNRAIPSYEELVVPTLHRVLAFLSISAVLMLTHSAQAKDPAPTWFKGNLHTHSLWSDGNDFPEMICDWYKSRGYHFLALSDHNILSKGEKWVDTDAAAKRGSIGGLERYLKRFGKDWVVTREKDGKKETRLKTLDEFRPLFEESGKFLLIQGEEVTDHFGNLPIHINATNIQEVIKPQGGKSVRETIAKNLIAIEVQSQRLRQPIFAHLNHPNFGYGVTAEDMAAVIEERFFEVYNGHPGVHHLGDATHAGTERLWDVANTIRIAEMRSPPLYGMATDDSHNYFGERGASPGRGWVMVRGDKLGAEPLIHSLQLGDFYASSGVELADIRFSEETGKLEIDIKAEPKGEYTTEFIGTKKGYDAKSEPVLDKDGKEISATRHYSKDVGQVLAKVTGPKVSFAVTADMYYVRAVVTASLPPENPSFDGQKKQAWTQPVGWNRHVAKANPSPPKSAAK